MVGILLGLTCLLFSIGIVPMGDMAFKSNKQVKQQYENTCKRYNKINDDLIKCLEHEKDYVIDFYKFVSKHHLVKRLNDTFSKYKKAYTHYMGISRWDDFKWLDKITNQFFDEMEKTIKIMNENYKNTLELDCYEAWEDKKVMKREMESRFEKQKIKDNYYIKTFSEIRKTIIKAEIVMENEMFVKEQKYDYTKEVIEGIIAQYGVMMYEEFLDSRFGKNLDLKWVIFN